MEFCLEVCPMIILSLVLLMVYKRHMYLHNTLITQMMVFQM